MIQLDGYAIKRNLTLEDYSTGIGESLSETANQTWIENPTSAISRLLELNQATGTYEPGVVGDYKPEKAILGWNTKDKAERKAKDAGVDLKFSDVGVSQEKLDILIERKREEVKRKAVIGMGPQGVLPGAAKIGTALAVSIADPLNVASAFIPVVSQANAVRLSAKLGKTGGRLATGAIEGAVGAAIIEPVVYAAMTAEQADYDLYDSYMNIVFGAAIGGGLHAGLGAIGDAIGRAPAQTKSDLLQSATGQALDNKPIDVSVVARESGASLATKTPDGKGIVLPKGIDIKQFEGLSVSQSGDSIIVRIPDELPVRAKDTFESSRAFDEYEAQRLERGRAIEQGEAIINKAVDDYSIKKVDTVQKHSNEADPKISSEYQAKLELKPSETPETVDALTNDILVGLDDIGADTTDIRAEIAANNQQIEREAKGLREAVMCMIG